MHLLAEYYVVFFSHSHFLTGTNELLMPALKSSIKSFGKYYWWNTCQHSKLANLQPKTFQLKRDFTMRNFFRNSSFVENFNATASFLCGM